LPHIEEDIFFNAYDPAVPVDQVYSAGLDAFRGALHDRLRDRLELDAVSHILVYCMGWNTDQQESLRNFNSLLLQLQRSFDRLGGGGAAFRPLVVGISWPSEWRWPVVEGLGKLLSYPVKSDDADEVGVTWANLLINDILVSLKRERAKQGHRVPLVLVGHSFGARVVTRAAVSAPLLGLPPSVDGIDMVVGLQGAFSINRFMPGDGLEGAPYADFTRHAAKFVLTWSSEDTANPVAAFVTGAKHAGGAPGHQRARERDAVDRFEHYEAQSYTPGPGTFKAPLPTGPGSRAWSESLRDGAVVTYIDASRIVRFEAYGKGGKAHSDIYTAQVADLLRSALVEGLRRSSVEADK
jgi:pimeloyl-ACP methyl ester carboxylesterase